MSVKPASLLQFIVEPRKSSVQPVLVALTTYENDSEAWLSQAIESVLAQSFKNFALLIAINGPVAPMNTEVIPLIHPTNTKELLLFSFFGFLKNRYHNINTPIKGFSISTLISLADAT